MSATTTSELTPAERDCERVAITLHTLKEAHDLLGRLQVLLDPSEPRLLDILRIPHIDLHIAIDETERLLRKRADAAGVGYSEPFPQEDE